MPEMIFEPMMPEQKKNDHILSTERSQEQIVASPEIDSIESDDFICRTKEMEGRFFRKDYVLDDYIKEWREHPEWHGLSTAQLRKEEYKDIGIQAFYLSIKKFAKKESGGDEEKRREIMERFFPARNANRENYSLEDYLKEWEEHPEWHGLATGQLRQDENKESGVSAFYKSLMKFAKKESGGDEEKRREIMECFFPARRMDRKNSSLEDYLKEWEEHPEWHGLSTGQINDEEGIKNGGSAFYSALLKFAKKESYGDEKKRREIMEKFFPVKVVRLEDYVKEWEEHLEWHGLSTSQISEEENLRNGANSFYSSLLYFAKKESGGDEEKRREIMERFFPSRRMDRKNSSLEDYVKEWEEHPEWHGLSTSQLKKKEYKGSGVIAFYLAINKFAKKESGGDEEKRREIMERFFPARNANRENYSLEDYLKEWEEHPEWHGLSTVQVAEKENVEKGAYSFYSWLLYFSKKESGGDEEKRREIMEKFFPTKYIYRKNYTLDSYLKEWEEHPEWHGTSISEEKSKKSGAYSFYSSLIKFAEKESGGDEKKRREMIEHFFPRRNEEIYKNRGWILQYSVEAILEIINNKNLRIEEPIKLEKRKGTLYPDLIYEYQDENFKKAVIFDIKLQTTTITIKKDKENYSKIIEEKYPDGGSLIFLCLNGPRIEKEDLDSGGKITIRYYHILDWLKRLNDNKRNKFLMRFIADNESQDISQIKDLSPEQISKINEIKERLEILKELVSKHKNSTHEDETLEEVAKRMGKIRNKMRNLVKRNKDSQQKISDVNFRELLDF